MKKITDISQLDPKGVYTYADYLTWQFEQAVELIKGKLMRMAAPNRKHQEISFQLSGRFYTDFKGLPCKSYTAPFDVRLLDKKKSLKANKDVLTVVQPDLCVICDKEKLDEKGCIGAPDLIVEILSASNSKKEMRIKKELYEENEVKEYWIIDPTHETLLQYSLQDNGVYTPPQIFVNDEIVQSSFFATLKVNLAEIFEIEEDI
jgi:Uma2 family endonuclease